MKTIVNLDNFKVISSEEWVLYLDNTPYDYEEHIGTIFLSNATTWTYEDMITTIDSIYESVFPNED